MYINQLFIYTHWIHLAAKIHWLGGYLFRQQPLYTGVSEDRGVFGYTLGTLLPKKKSILRASGLSPDSI